MALGSNCNNGKSDTLVQKKVVGFGVRTKTIGRKRIVLAQSLESSPFGSPPSTPPQKRYHRMATEERLHLESLPRDILVRILCCVDHDDLKQLFNVSKSVRDAAQIAEKMHFAYSTPSSKSARLTPFSDLEDPDKCDDEAPDAPRQQRFRSRLDRQKLAGISVALFTTPE